MDSKVRVAKLSKELKRVQMLCIPFVLAVIIFTGYIAYTAVNHG